MPNGELSEHIAETIRDYTAYKDLSEDSPYTSNCVIYVPDKSGNYLANKQHIVIKNAATDKELVNVVLERFLTLYDELLPADIEIIEITINQHSGKQNVSISVNGNLNDVTLEMLRAGITLTLTGYIPNLHYVTIIFGEDSATIQRKDYAYKIGNATKVYYPYLLNDVLSARSITINKGLACCYLKDYLGTYFASSVENGSIFRGMKEEYILDIYVNNGVCVLNLSQEFYDMFDKYINNEHAIVDGDVSERLIIYGIVNSLTEVHYINSVLFLSEGKNLGIIKNLYLGAPLYKNIGLVYGA
ncbi:MAG: GerMN domain-containing protein [Clostridiales bacterium]|nr:GerMN domain-containing protein [Clostridiales bacterium]